MAPGYITLTYLVDFGVIKFYLLPIMLAKYGRGSISLQSPVNYQFENGRSVRQVLSLSITYLFVFDTVAIATTGKPRTPSFTFFSSSAVILLVVWSTNGYCSVLPRKVPKVNLLNDDTYQCDSATIMCHPSDK